MRILIAGAGGFIGGHLTRWLAQQGHQIRAVDIKPIYEWWQVNNNDQLDIQNKTMHDLRREDTCMNFMVNVDQVYNLASNMGGIGFIETHKADCMTSVLINTNLLRAAVKNKVQRYFYSSSACVYHAERQSGYGPASLQESDAYFNGGAMPEDGYGWEKLFSERMCRHFMEDYGLQTRVARLHNVTGPHGSWRDGREKAPAAICRKVAEAKLSGKHVIDVWGDGSRRRSYMYIDDCMEGITRIMASDIREPINLGSSEMVSVNKLIDIIQGVAGIEVGREYDLSKPQGVAGRNSDNTLILEKLGWQPTTSLRDGLVQTYPWIEKQVARRHK